PDPGAAGVLGALLAPPAPPARGQACTARAPARPAAERAPRTVQRAGRLVPLPAIHACFWPAITRRESPPSPLPRRLSLAAGECGRWLGARDPKAGQHHWKGTSS